MAAIIHPPLRCSDLSPTTAYFTQKAGTESVSSAELLEDEPLTQANVATVPNRMYVGEADHHAKPQRKLVQQPVGVLDPMSGSSPGLGQPLPKSTRVDECTKARVVATEVPADQVQKVPEVIC